MGLVANFCEGFSFDWTFFFGMDGFTYRLVSQLGEQCVDLATHEAMDSTIGNFKKFN